MNKKANESAGFEIEIVKILLQKTTDELNRSWTRNNIMITINAGLLALVATGMNKLNQELIVGFSVLGIITSIAWLQIARYNKYNSERWRNDTAAYLKQFPEMQGLFSTAAKRSSLKRPAGPKASTCMKVIAVTLCVIWLLLGLFSILDYNMLSKDNREKADTISSSNTG